MGTGRVPRHTEVKYEVDIDDLAARFQSCAIPKAEWTHQAHLVVGLWHVERYGSAEALARLRSGIRRLNESHGGVNTATNGYHETITRAYVALLSQYLDGCQPDRPLTEHATRLLDSPLADGKVLFLFYSRDRLISVTARAEWIEPDIAPLSLAAVYQTARL